MTDNNTSKPPKFSDERIQIIMEESLQRIKKTFAKSEPLGIFAPIVLLLFDMKKEGLQIQPIEGSDKFFQQGVNTGATILHATREIMKLITKDRPGEYKLAAVIVISEVFYTSHTAPREMSQDQARVFAEQHEQSKDYIPPRDNPAHVEALMLFVCTRDGSYIYSCPYTREGNKIVYTNEKDELAESIGGRFDKLFPDEFK